MLVAGRDVQCAAAVDGQIGAAEDDAVHIAVFVRQNITLPVGQGILAAFREGQENLIGLPDEEGGVLLTVNGDVVKHNLNFGRVGRVDNNLSIIERTCEEIDSLLCDGENAARGGRSRTGDHNAVP